MKGPILTTLDKINSTPPPPPQKMTTMTKFPKYLAYQGIFWENIFLKVYKFISLLFIS